MNSMSGNHEAEILRLTQTAFEAARSGQWDVVIQCYRERGVLLESAEMPVSEAQQVLKLDSQVRDQVQATQAVLTSLLGQAAVTRHRLQGLRQRLGVPASAPEAMSVEA
jgi:hypothetical protein